MMAVQFLDVSGTKKVLFVGTSVAMNAACCCGPAPLEQCCEGTFPDSLSVTCSGFAGDPCGVINGTFVADFYSAGSMYLTYLGVYVTGYRYASSGDYPRVIISIGIACDLSNSRILIEGAAQVEAYSGAQLRGCSGTKRIAIEDDGSTACEDYFDSVLLDGDDWWFSVLGAGYDPSPLKCTTCGTITVTGIYD